MISRIVPVFITSDIPRTIAYYGEKLGFECLGTWSDPPVYAILARDQRVIHFRCATAPTPSPDKYEKNCWTLTSTLRMQTRFMLSLRQKN